MELSPTKLNHSKTNKIDSPSLPLMNSEHLIKHPSFDSIESNFEQFNMKTRIKKKDKELYEMLSHLKNTERRKSLLVPKTKPTSDLNEISDKQSNKEKKSRKLAFQNEIVEEKEEIREIVLADNQADNSNLSIFESRVFARKPMVFDSFDMNEMNTEEEQAMVRRRIDPTSRGYRLFICFLDLNIFVSFFALAWAVASQNFNLRHSFFSVVSDIVMLADVCLSFFLGKFSDDGELIGASFMDRLLEYLIPWFIIDFVASLPSIYFLRNLDSNEETDRKAALLVIMVIRFLKLGKENSWFNTIVFTPNDLEMNRILKFLVIFCFFTHFTTCCWIFLGQSELTFREDKLSFFSDDDNSYLYVKALYYSVVTSLSVGYGDIFPTSTVERCFSCAFMLCGVIFYSFLLTSFSKYFAEEKPADILMNHNINTLYSITREFGLDNKLFRRLKDHLEMPKKGLKSTSLEFVTSLPANLRKTLINTMFGSIVYKIKMFNDLPESMVLNVLPNLCVVRYNKSEVILSLGDFFKEIEIVWNGKLTLFLPFQDDIFKVGQVFKHESIGEAFLVTSEQSPFNIRCDSRKYEGFVIKRSSFSSLHEDFPSFVDSIVCEAIKRKTVLDGRVKIAKISNDEESIEELNAKMVIFNKAVTEFPLMPVNELHMRVEELVDLFKKAQNDEEFKANLELEIAVLVEKSQKINSVKIKEPKRKFNLLFKQLKGNMKESSIGVTFREDNSDHGLRKLKSAENFMKKKKNQISSNDLPQILHLKQKVVSTKLVRKIKFGNFKTEKAEDKKKNKEIEMIENSLKKLNKLEELIFRKFNLSG